MRCVRNRQNLRGFHPWFLFYQNVLLRHVFTKRNIVPISSARPMSHTVHDTQTDKSKEVQTRKFIIAIAIHSSRPKRFEIVKTSTKCMTKVHTFENFEQTYSSKVGRGVMDVYSLKLFYIIISNLPNFVAAMARQQCFHTTSQPLFKVVHAKSDVVFPNHQPSTLFKPVNVAHHKPTTNLLELIIEYGTV